MNTKFQYLVWCVTFLTEYKFSSTNQYYSDNDRDTADNRLTNVFKTPQFVDIVNGNTCGCIKLQKSWKVDTTHHHLAYVSMSDDILMTCGCR